MIDLHTHSTASDGTYDPGSLVDLAADRKLTALALTDHDTLDGLEEAAAEARRRHIRFIPGVEIEIAFSPGEFHLLGLDLKRTDGEIREASDRLARSRDERNERIFQRMRDAGIQGSYEELREAFPAGMIGRPHIADYLIARKAVRNKKDAFDRFLAKGRPFYVSKDCLELKDALRIIRDAGGLPVVAHPLSLFVSWTRLRVLFLEWREMGLTAIEAWHPTAKVGHCQRLEALGRELGFRITAGSDFHGANRPDRRLGYTAGDKPIDESFLKVLDE